MMSKYIIDDIEISSDEENSDENKNTHVVKLIFKAI